MLSPRVAFPSPRAGNTLAHRLRELSVTATRYSMINLKPESLKEKNVYARKSEQSQSGSGTFAQQSSISFQRFIIPHTCDKLITPLSPNLKQQCPYREAAPLRHVWQYSRPRTSFRSREITHPSYRSRSP